MMRGRRRWRRKKRKWKWKKKLQLAEDAVKVLKKQLMERKQLAP